VADGFDLAVRFGHPRPSTLVARKLLDTRMVTVAAPAYLKRHGRPEDPRELEKGHHVCIQFRDPETGRPYPWEFHRRRRKLVLETSGSLTVNDAGTLYSVCLAGHGMAQVMDLGVGPMIADGRLVDGVSRLARRAVSVVCAAPVTSSCAREDARVPGLHHRAAAIAHAPDDDLVSLMK
jgi:DNA-binding transcriptional LysR family regulator